MGLHEYRGDTDRDRGAREHRNELALAAAGASQPARPLYRVGGIENHRPAGLGQLRQRAHIADQRVVAEARAALADHHVGVAGGLGFRDHVGHVPWRQKLSLLDVERPAGLRCGDDQVGLPAQERRDLQNIDRLRRVRALLGGVDIGENRAAQPFAHLGQDRQSRLDPDAAPGSDGGPVGLVERGFVDQPDPGPVRDLDQPLGAVQRMRPAFDLARPGNQCQRRVVGDLDGADPDSVRSVQDARPAASGPPQP